MLRDATGWRQLISEYGQLRRLDGHTPQSRGRRFNEVIAELLRCWGIEATTSVRTTGEIDVAFSLDGVRFVVEAKWEQAKADTGDIAKLQKRVRQRLAGTYGLFLSMSGYSPNALADVTDGERLEVLLLDAAHWEAMLAGLVPPDELLALIHDRAAFHGEPYTPLTKLFTVHPDLPEISFEPPSAMTDGALLSAVKGVEARIVLSGIKSHQLGITCHERNRLLVTTERGILDVDLDARTSKIAVPVPNCHRNPLVLDDGAILFTRKHGVGRFHRGELTTIGGGVAGNSCLLVNPDGSIWVFDNGGPRASVTKLDHQLGDHERHEVNYPPSAACSAVWLSESDLVTIGNPDIVVSSLPPGTEVHHQAPQANPMGIVHLGEGVILTAGDSVTLRRTDTKTWTSHEVARLAVKPSVNELALGTTNDVYLAAYYQSPEPGMPFAVIQLRLPTDPPTREQHTSTSEPAATHVYTVNTNNHAEPQDQPPTTTPPVNRPIGSPDTATATPLDPLDHAVNMFASTREDERDRGYQDALQVAPSLPWHELENLARHNFDIPAWLKSWKNGWMDIETGKAPAAAKVAAWLPVLADYLGDLVDPFGFDRWSFKRSNEYVTGFAQALQDVWTKVKGRPPGPTPPRTAAVASTQLASVRARRTPTSTVRHRPNVKCVGSGHA